MKPVYQTIDGPDGNCFAACVASLLEVPLKEVPNFRECGNEWTANLSSWVNERNYSVVFKLGDGRPLRTQQKKPSGYAVLGHRVIVTGHIHAALFFDGELVHDPSPRPYCNGDSLVLLWTCIKKKGD